MTAHPRFALTGAAGFVAPRHMKAIHDVGGELVATLDPHDAVGVLDQYGRYIEFFTEPERFDRHLHMLRREGTPVEWLSVCSPNYLHDVHTRMGLLAGANVICEKPLALTPRGLDAIAEDERRSDRRVYTVLQLRLLPALVNLRARVEMDGQRHKVAVHYMTPRGRWYQHSWKGDENRSGGLAMNIGVHMFDALIWIFGPVQQASVRLRTSTTISGMLELERADVDWFLSIAGEEAQRLIRVDGEDVPFSDGFNELHTKLYRMTLDGLGFGVETARPAIELAYRLRSMPIR